MLHMLCQVFSIINGTFIQVRARELQGKVLKISNSTVENLKNKNKTRKKKPTTDFGECKSAQYGS